MLAVVLINVSLFVNFYFLSFMEHKRRYSLQNIQEIDFI